MKRTTGKSYRDTPFGKEIESKCLSYERSTVQNILWSNNPRKEFEKIKDKLSESCREVLERMIRWLEEY